MKEKIIDLRKRIAERRGQLLQNEVNYAELGVIAESLICRSKASQLKIVIEEIDKILES